MTAMRGSASPEHIPLLSDPDVTSLTEGLGDEQDSRVRMRKKSKRKVYHIPALNEKFESLDYDIIENQLQKEEEKSSRYSELVWSRSRNRWIVCFLIGFFTAIIGVVVYTVVNVSINAKFNFLSSELERCKNQDCLMVTLVLWLLINIFCVLVAVVTCVYLSGPVASGSGIPQIKCFLNGIKIPYVLRFSTLVSKIVGVVGGVIGGLHIGKQGPMIHTGAIVAGGVSQGRCITCPIDFNFFEYFRSDKEKRDFVSAGAAAGVAAAFNAPIGGVLFSMEEGASFWSQPLTWRTFFCSMTSYFFLNLFLSTIFGHGLTWTGIANFGVVETGTDYAIWEIPLFLLMGAIGGLSGAFFNFLNVRLTVFRMHYIDKQWKRVVEAVLIASVSTVLGFLLVFYVPKCHPLGTVLKKHPVQLWCPDGYYNEMASLMFVSPEKAVQTLFHYDAGAFSIPGLLIFLPFYFFMASVTYGIHISFGIFVPQLLIGAVWGRAMGLGLVSLFPSQGKHFVPSKYAIIGAGAQLSGVLRMTLSLCVIIMESVQNLNLGMPLMLVMIVAKFLGDRFNRGIYDHHIDLQEVPVLGWEAPETASVVSASRVMSSPVKVLRTTEKVSRVLRILNSDAHHGYPVVSDFAPEQEDIYYNVRLDRWERPADFGQLEGFISRAQLIVLLQKRAFTPVWLRELRMAEETPKLRLEDFRVAYPRYTDALERLNLSSEDLDSWVDLKPYMDLAPFTVTEGASLRRIFNLCRQLGLRHAVVVNQEHRVVGIVTRKDVARFREERDKAKKRFRIREIHISG